MVTKILAVNAVLSCVLACIRYFLNNTAFICNPLQKSTYVIKIFIQLYGRITMKGYDFSLSMKNCQSQVVDKDNTLLGKYSTISI